MKFRKVNRMKVNAAAKINLMLDVLGTLPDGYHSLFMVMQSVSCFDTVCVEKTDRGGIEVEAGDSRVPAGEDNIVYKTAKLFFEKTGVENPGVRIGIEKRIPMAAGLAGGSADAAGTLYCLREMFAPELDRCTLLTLGERIGADVPFALTGGTALCMDKGGVIAPLRQLSDCFVVLCKPDMDVSTKNAYQKIDEAPHLRHLDKNAMLYAVHNGDFPLLCEKAGNVFEQVIEVPQRPYIKGIMRECGASLALMSGSGPTVFGLFARETDAKRCALRLQDRFSDVHLCKPVSCGVEVLEK